MPPDDPPAMVRLARLPVRLGTLSLHNPVMPASGTFDWNEGEHHPLDASTLGAVVFKTVTLDARRGNPPPRLHEIRGGLLNSIGIPSVGLHAFLQRRRAQLRRLGTVRIVSIAGFAPWQYAEACRILDEEDVVDAVELNLSCPNIETDSVFATDIAMLEAIVGAARHATAKPLIAKLAPNVPDIRPFVRVAETAGADMLCIANTFSGLAIDVHDETPVLGNVVGGVSSPALLPIILKHVWDARTVTSLPILASGGIYQADDAIQYLLAGANAVQIGTANYGDPMVMARVVEGIQDHLVRIGVPNVEALTGRANPLAIDRRAADQQRPAWKAAP